jgi:hypothetical protein
LNGNLDKNGMFTNTCIKKAVVNNAQINYRVNGVNESSTTNNILINILEEFPIYPECEPIAFNCCLDICKNSSISKRVKVININRDYLEYEIIDYPEKGFATIDQYTGVWKYTSKVGYTGLDRFIIRITTSLGSEVKSIVTINLKDSFCSQCNKKISK